MKPLKTDLSIYAKFEFELPPIGIKFLFFKPDPMSSLQSEKPLSLCEILVEAQNAEQPFYFDRQ